MTTIGRTLALLACAALPAAATAATGQDAALAPDPATKISQYVHDVWQTEDGLPANDVQAIVHGRDGFLWLATRGGLVRFDGVRFRVFNMVTTPIFGSDDFGALVEGADGSLWIGSRGAGLYRYREGSFTAHPAPSPASSDLRALLVDRAGQLWAGSLGGLLRMTGGELAAVGEPLLARADVRALFEDPDGTLWIGTRSRGVFHRRDGRLAPLAAAADLASDQVNAILRDRAGALWLGTASGLKRLADDGAKVYRRADGLADDDVRALYEDAAGSLWIATANGLVRFRDGRFESFAERAGAAADLVRAVHVDREGNLWIGTYGSGLHRFKVGPITTFTAGDGLAHDGVWSLAGDGSGNLLVGYGDGGVDLLANGTASPYARAEAFPRSPVYSLLAGSRGDFWAGTETGLMRYGDGRLRVYATADGLPDDRVRIVYEDPRQAGVLWIGTFGGGASRFAGGVFRTWDTSSGLPNDNVRALLRDRAGALWIGTESGLARLEDGDLAVSTTADGLASNAIRALYEDADGSLWIGTRGGGIARRRDGRIVAYTTRQGLPHNDVWAILEDGYGHLWWSSDQGLVRLRKSDFEAYDRGRIAALPARAYGLDDGMKVVECNGVGFPSAWASGGELFFASMGGVVRVDPRPQPAGAPSPTYVESLLADGEAVDLGAPVELRPDQRNVQIAYTSPRLRDPESVRFRYRLSPFDRDWIDAGTRREAFYTNLPPGAYELRVDAGKGEDGGAAVLAFAVRPHFHETWWFRLGGVLALGLALGFGFVQWTRGIRSRNLRLEEEIGHRRSVEAELEVKVAELAAKNQELERFTYTVSHDLKAPLVTVRGFLGLVRKDVAAGKVERLEHDLARIDAAAESMAALLDDLLSLSRVGLESRPPQKVALGGLARGALERVAVLVRERGVEVEIADDLPAVLGDPARLTEVLQNLLENAVKYMGDEASPRVEVGVLRDGAEPVFFVRDNGMGIEPEYHEKIFGLFERLDTKSEGSGVGLALVRRIVEAHGGWIRVESAGRGEGSTFCFCLPSRGEAG